MRLITSFLGQTNNSEELEETDELTGYWFGFRIRNASVSTPQHWCRGFTLLHELCQNGALSRNTGLRYQEFIPQLPSRERYAVNFIREPL